MLGALGVLASCALDWDLPGNVGAAGDAGNSGSSWCSGQGAHQLCEDFDEFTSVTQVGTSTWSEGVVSLDTQDWRSPPNSFLGQTPPQSNNVYAQAAAKWAWSGRVTQAHLAFDAKIETADLTDWGDLLQIAFGTAYTLNLTYNDIGTNEVFVREASPSQDYRHDSHAFAFGTSWVHITVDLVAGSTMTVTYSLDGQPFGPETLLAGWEADVPSLAVGVIGSNGQTTGWAIAVDNVVFDSQ